MHSQSFGLKTGGLNKLVTNFRDVHPSDNSRRRIPIRRHGVPIIAVSGRWRFAPNRFRQRPSEALRKAILAAAMALGLYALDEKSDPGGTWKCEYEIGGQKRSATQRVKKDGDKLAWTMDWPDQKDVKVKDLKM